MSRTRFSTQIASDLGDRVRAAIVGLGKRGVQISLAEATESALEAWVRHIEEDYNDGKPFTPAAEDLRRGQRVRLPAIIPPNSEEANA